MSVLARVPEEPTERLAQIQRLEINRILKSVALPESYLKDSNGRPRTEEQTIALLHHVAEIGRGLGARSVASSIAIVYLIKDKPYPSADGVAGAAEKQRIVTCRVLGRPTAKSVVVAGFRNDWPAKWKEQPTEIEWTIEMAHAAGLTNKPGAWKTQPRQMLEARAKRELIKLLAPEIFIGVDGQPLVFAEDIEDGVVIPPQETDIDGDTVDAEIVEDELPNWPDQWRAAIKAAGLTAAASKAIVRFASEGKYELASDLEDVDRPLAETTLDNIVAGRWHLDDGKVVETPVAA